MLLMGKRAHWTYPSECRIKIHIIKKFSVSCYHGSSWFSLAGEIHIAFNSQYHEVTFIDIVFLWQEGKEHRILCARWLSQSRKGYLTSSKKGSSDNRLTLSSFNLGPLLFKVKLCLPVLTTPSSNKVHFYALASSLLLLQFILNPRLTIQLSLLSLSPSKEREVPLNIIWTCL